MFRGAIAIFGAIFGATFALIAVFSQFSVAEDVSVTDVRVFYGTGFHDAAFNEDTANGTMTTISLQHFGTWHYGENYFEADTFQGHFTGDNVSSTGNAARIYVKWVSRLGLGEITKKQGEFFPGLLDDVFVSARMDRQGNGYYANMAGIGLGFMRHEEVRLGSDFFVRKDKFNSATWQVSPYWYLVFRLGPSGQGKRPRFVFTGFVDFAGTDNLGVDVTSEPELLWDIGELTVRSTDRLYFGFSPFFHYNSSIDTVGFQGEFRWVF